MSAGVQPRERGIPYSVFLSPTGAVEQNLRPPRLGEALGQGGQLWVDIESTDPHQHALLEKVFGFHHLAIEDTLSPRTRVKLEEYGDYLFVVVRELRFDAATEDPYDLETVNLYCFLGNNYLVTVRSGPSRAVETVQDRLARSPDLLQRGVEMIAHGLLDTAVDQYLPIVDQVDEMVDELQERVFRRYDERAIHEIFKLKRVVVQVRRHLAPLREVLNILTNRPHVCIAASAQVYFRDVYDHTIRIVESVDSVRDLLTTVLDTHLTQASNRLSAGMKSLSVVATLSLPLVVVGGIFGMNFADIPLAQHPWGFFWAIGLMGALAGALFWFLRTRGWV